MANPIKFRDIKSNYINAETEFIFSDNSTQNCASCLAYSFFLDIAGQSYGAASIGLRSSITLDLNQSIIGWPILPHGAGSYFNSFGTFILGIPFNWDSKPVSYSYFQSTNGEITHMSINYDLTSWDGTEVYVRAINYTNGDISEPITLLLNQERIGSKSIKFNTPLGFLENHHIGIYIEDRRNGDGPVVGTRNTGCIIEGSLLVKLIA